MIKSAQDVKSLGTILGVWAHPDDEIFSMAGIMAAAVRNGQQVICITATRGEAGVQDESRWPASELAAIRSRELDRAYDILGVTEHHWLDYADGGCDQVDESEAAAKIAEFIERYQPDSILTFDETGMTGHPDHKCMHHWALLAHKKTASQAVVYTTALTSGQYEAYKKAGAQKDVFFNIDNPPVCSAGDCQCCLELTDELYRLKLEALRAMPSQTESLLGRFGAHLRPALSIEAFKKV